MLQCKVLSLLTPETWGYGEKTPKSSNRKDRVILSPSCMGVELDHCFPIAVLPSQGSVPFNSSKAMDHAESKEHFG